MAANCQAILTKSHSGDASTTILGLMNFDWVDGEPDSSSGITENLPRWRNGEPWGISRKRPTEVGSGGGATVTLKRPRDSASESISLLKFSSNTSEKYNSREIKDCLTYWVVSIFRSWWFIIEKVFPEKLIPGSTSSLFWKEINENFPLALLLLKIKRYW